MKLEMIGGRESSLVVESVRNSIEEEGFLSDSYLKALHALCDYIKNSEKITKELSDSEDGRNSILYRSAPNIIAFSGKRGSGKTSAMLSFSSMLGNLEKIKELRLLSQTGDVYSKLKDKYFMVLDPVDPTSLEKNQSILSVVLSRLLKKAEQSWQRHVDFYGNFQDKESVKTKILFLARQCLNGISAVKSKKDVPTELSELQKVGDSSILKLNLYDFVSLVLQFSQVGLNVSQGSSFLVLQIDDTDCQIGQGYEVMEDIRKYLTIPNVLILMATDTKLLRKVLVQHYIADFKYSVDMNFTEKDEIKNLGEKYMAKLMPPTQVIYLPNIDEFIRDRTDLIHLYYYKDELRESSYLEMCNEGNHQKCEFQSVILRYIYRKTHLVFVSHDAYANNIIPTTLRGLAYLLNMLSSMEDIPEVDFGSKASGKSDTEYLVERTKEQLPIWEKNLNLFEEYFMHDWIQAKLPYEMVRIVEELAEQVPDQRVPFLIKKLKEFYKEKNQNNTSGFVAYLSPILDEDDSSYSKLDDLFRTLQGTKENTVLEEANRGPEDFYFIFAVKTLLSIKNNKDVLKVKDKVMNSWKSTHNSKIVFNYLKEKTSLPTGFYLEPVKLYGYSLVTGEKERQNISPISPSYYFYGKLSMHFNFTGGIVEWLNPRQRVSNLSQREIYEAQELAVLVAANCDVQEKVRKSVAREAKDISVSKVADSLIQAVEWGFALIQKGIVKINQNMFDQYRLEANQNSVWKISEESKLILEKYDVRLAVNTKEKSPTDEVGVDGGKNKEQQEFPKFISPLSVTAKNETRGMQFHQEVEKYKEELMNYIEAQGKNIDSHSMKCLDELIHFVPEFNEGFFKNQEELKTVEENLYASLEKLFFEKGY